MSVRIPRVGWWIEDNDTDVYQEILATKCVKYRIIKESIGYGHYETYLEVDDVVSDCVSLWFKSRNYAGMQLHEFLDRTCPDGIQREIQNICR